jgi:hypothetical protein
LGTQHSVRPVDDTQYSGERVIAVTARSTLDDVLDQLRDLPPGPVAIALAPLSLLFSTPDQFRALDGVRIARSLAVTIAVDDPHRTGLALAFGYRVRPREAPKNTQPALARLGVAPVNSPNGTHALAERVVTEDDPVDSEHTEMLDARRRSPIVWMVGILVALIVTGIGGAALLVERVHTAEVVITPAVQSFSRVVPFAVSVAPTDDPNTMQTTLFATTIAREGDAPATGTATVPDGTAAGTMTFRSRADGAATIKAGTTLKGPRDVSYTLAADVVVPGLDFVRGQLGEASGRVRATQPGPNGNLSAGFSARYTDNITYISGDIGGGTEKQVPVVTDDDIAGVRSTLENDLRAHALAEANAALPAGATALNDYLALGVPVMTAQPVAGTQASSVHVRVALTAQVPTYRNADFDALIDRRLNDTVREAAAGGDGPREVLPATVTKSRPVFVDVQGPLVRYFATVSGQTRSVIADADLQQLRARLTGKENGDAAHILAGMPTVGQSRIVYGPSWLPQPIRTRMPRTAAHIRLRVETGI